jgi:hypothetical protein
MERVFGLGFIFLAGICEILKETGFRCYDQKNAIPNEIYQYHIIYSNLNFL